MTEDEIEALGALEKAATPSAWEPCNSWMSVVYDGNEVAAAVSGPDQRLIAAARNALPALLGAASEANRLRAENERLRVVFEAAKTWAETPFSVHDLAGITERANAVFAAIAAAEG